MSFRLARPSFLLFFIISIFFNFTVAAQKGPIVKTNKGYIRGLDERGIDVFKGVPYAAPPVGPLRFMPTTEHTPWNDTLEATKFGEPAKQVIGGKISGSEDCLTLNIYTPHADNRKRPVVVWVHGGSMTNGAGKGMDGHAFADHDDIVTITINYRLGVFGFMYLGDVDKRYAQSGNNGTLDVIMALKWIKQNIAAFGGDPNRVTIMGESAGAKLISAVLVSPLSKGLFQQYIAESGSVQCIRDVKTAINERTQLLNDLVLSPADGRKLLTMPAESLMYAQNIACTGLGGNSFFGPVYDGVTIKDDAYHYAASNSLPRIKALIGTNEYEAALFFPRGHLDTTILRSLYGDDAPMVYTEYLNQLKTDTDRYDASVKVLTQYMYQMHSYRFAKVLTQNNIPVWMYRFQYDNGKKYGAMHAAELPYIWDEQNLSSSPDKAKRKLQQDMHAAWVSFIKTGNPGISEWPQWPNYQADDHEVMFINTTSTVSELKNVFDDKTFPSAVFVLK